MQTWLVETVRYFRGLDFFAAERLLSDEQLVRKVEAAHRANWDEPLDPAAGAQLADMYVVATDPTRIWWRDIECVYQGANAYVEILGEWAAISRGAFFPTHVSETWRSPRGPVEVEFSVGAVRHRFIHQDGHDDFVDMRIVRAINQAIGATGYQFAVCDEGGMPNFVVALTRDEQARLERERGWRFYL
jgi:hypothetical protein